MQRQLEDEIDVEKNLGINPKDFHPDALLTPREDDTFSPLHDEDADDKPKKKPQMTINQPSSRITMRLKKKRPNKNA